ncbi:MAG TPA: F0F1 ATP synthase subunit epsilon [Rhizomicrobium sp.]|nr:F0F1 ATP synthase subunit epsilon [Rhizomicrobium sp.]
MADKISFDLVSPERLLLSDEAEMVTLPGTEGEFGVLAGHAPVISTLKPGVIDVKGGTGGDARFFVMGGFAEVNPNKLTVLAEEAIPMAEVDAAALDQRIRNTEEDILTAKTETERAKAVESLDSLKILRAAL